MSRILEEISRNISLSRIAGFHPVLILISPKLFGQLIQELDAKFMEFTDTEKGTLLGLKYEFNRYVADFLVVDDRSWVDQKF